MSATSASDRRFFRKRWLLALAVVIVVGACLGVWRYFWMPRPPAPDPSRTFRDLPTILAEYEKGWECAVGPERDGPFRSPEDCKGYSLIVGMQGPIKYRNQFGEIDVTIPYAVDRAYAVIPLETADGQLTYIILEKLLPPDDPARQRAEKGNRDGKSG